MKTSITFYISFVCILLFSTFLISCHKGDKKTIITLTKELLSGTNNFGNNAHSWKLDSVQINGKDSILSKYQIKYIKTYNANGIYTDSDLSNGLWELSSETKLKEIILYNTSNRRDSNLYDILSINAYKLKMRSIIGKDKVDYVFNISN